MGSKTLIELEHDQNNLNLAFQTDSRLYEVAKKNHHRLAVNRAEEIAESMLKHGYGYTQAQIWHALAYAYDYWAMS